MDINRLKELSGQSAIDFITEGAGKNYTVFANKKGYDDSAQFTEDFTLVEMIVKSKAWKDWMKDSEDHGAHVVALNKELIKLIDKIWDELESV